LLCQEIASHSQQLEGELTEAKINQAHVGGEFLPSVQRQAIEISTPCVKAKSQEKQEQTEQMAERLGQRLASVEQLSARLGT